MLVRRPAEPCQLTDGTHVLASKVTTLEHELGDDTVERGVLVAEAVLTGAELAEVAGGLGDDVVEELEDNAAHGGW